MMLIRQAYQISMKLFLGSLDKCDDKTKCGDSRCCNDPKYGTCINLQDPGPSGREYNCLCKDGFTGIDCEESEAN